MVSLFIQGKPLASGYYSRHPETTQYNKDKDKEKRKTEERTQKSKSTVAGENSKCSMQQLNIQVSVFIEMRVSQNNNMQLLRIPQGIQIHVKVVVLVGVCGGSKQLRKRGEMEKKKCLLRI